MVDELHVRQLGIFDRHVAHLPLASTYSVLLLHSVHSDEEAQLTQLGIKVGHVSHLCVVRLTPKAVVQATQTVGEEQRRQLVMREGQETQAPDTVVNVFVRQVRQKLEELQVRQLERELMQGSHLLTLKTN